MRRRVDFVAARGDGEDFKILDVRREGAVRGVVDGGGENGEALLVKRTCNSKAKKLPKRGDVLRNI